MIQLLRFFMLRGVYDLRRGEIIAAGNGRCVRVLLLVTMMAIPWVAGGQTLGEYVYSTGVDTTKWVDMDAATQILTPVGNDGLASSVQNIGFDFPFGEEVYSQFSVNTDGNLRLGATVTGTTGYSTPFSAANANANNPKINAFGCDGYSVSGIHYVKALNTVDGSGRPLLVVEFCTGTYTNSTRNNLYNWQVHLYANGDVEIVYGPAPAAPPAAAHQCGLCVDASDGWTINAGHLATYFTLGNSTTIPTGNWPTEGRYYRFDMPVYSCPKPTSLACTNLTPFGFNLSWTDTSDAASWIVRMVDEDDSVVYDHVVNLPSASFTGLVPATIYTVSVAGLCQNGDTSRARTQRVQTPCVPLATLPYRMDFDSVDAVATTSLAESNLPSCWTNYNTGTSTSYSGYPIVYNNAANAHSGTNSMRFYTYATAGTYSDQMAVLPMTDSATLPLSDMQLSFWMRSTSTSYSSYVVVGVITDPTDPSTFHPIETVPTHGSTTYEQHTVMLAAYHGPYGRVAIMAPQPATSYNALLIDDVALKQAPSCLPVFDLRVTLETADSIALAWTRIGSETAWLVADGTHEVMVYDTVYTLSGLTANTGYTLSVRAYCGPNDTSAAVTVSARTACNNITTLPFSENFDGMIGLTNTSAATNNLPFCWSYYNIGTSTTYSGYPIVYSSSTYAHSGSNAMRFYTYITAGTYSDQIAVMPPTDSVVLPISSLQVTFWMRANTSSYNSYVVVGVMSDPTDASTFVPVETIYTNSSTTYADYTVMFGQYHGRHGQIAFKVPQPASGYNYLYIDDITIDHMPTCPGVSDITVVQVTSDTIGITWTPMGTESQWLVGDGTNTYVSNDTMFAFGGLEPNTEYTLSVRALCNGGTDTSSALTITASTTCSDIRILPFRENFDSYVGYTSNQASVNNLPPCWGYINHGTRTNYMGYPIILNNYAYSGGNCMRFYSFHNAADSNQYAILPPTDSTLFPVNSLMLSFYMRASSAASTYKSQAVVGVILNPLDNRTFVPIDTVYANGVTTYSLFEIDFSNYTGPHGSVAFMFPQPAGSGFNYNAGYIDDIVLEQVPDCLPVNNLTVSNITINSADLSWVDTNSYTLWNVEYGTPGFLPGTGTATSVDSTHLTLTGLTTNTAYDVYVSPDCPGGIAGLSLLSFRTDCGTIDTLPFFEDFDSHLVGLASYAPPDCGIPCWQRIDNAGTYHYGIIGNPSEWPTGARSGSGFLYYYYPPTSSAYADWTYTILPPINTDLFPMNTLQFSFWVKMDVPSTSGTIIAGVMTDPTQPSSFVPLDTMTVGGNVYVRKEVMMDNYTDSGAYIALLLQRNPSNISYYFIDDFMVEPIPICLPVENINLTAVDSNSLTVGWVEAGNATSWTVEYGLRGFAQGLGTSVTATAVPFTILGLTHTTEYDVYITPNCSGESTLTRMATFRTSNRQLNLPFSCNFEDTVQNACWALENGTNYNRWVIGSATNHGGTHSLYITNDNGVSNDYYNSNSNTVGYAYVDLVFPTAGDYVYTFDWKCNGESTSDYLRAALIPVAENPRAATSLPPGLTFYSLPASWLPLDGGRLRNLQPNWQTNTDVVSVPTAGVYHMAFIFRCDGSGGSTPPPAIDNITMAYSTCIRPDSLVLGNLTQTTADFTWTEMGYATEWQYQLDNDSIYTVYNTNAVLTGLTASTDYTFKVRSVCGMGDTSYWRYYEFRTPCSYISLPYVQDFESELQGSSTSDLFASCWYRLNNGLTYFGYPYIGGSDYNHTAGGSQGLNWYNSTSMGSYGDYQCIVFPAFDTSVDISELQLSFWTRTTSVSFTPVFYVGVMTDPSNIATFEPVDTVTFTGTLWREVSVLLSDYVGHGHFLAIKAERSTDYWYAYLDDITLDYITTCHVPEIVYASNTTGNSLTLDWVDIDPSTEWQVEYGRQGYTRGSAEGTMITTYTHPVVVNGLDPLAQYDFYIRPVCGENDTAHWRFPTTLTTGMCDNSLIAATGYATSPGTNYRYPVNNYYRYSLTETIIDSAELGGEMDIEYISYYYAGTDAMNKKNNCTIYFQPTSLTAFSSASAAVALDTHTAVRVYTGSLNCSEGWNFFQLDTVYRYDGLGNLLVIVDDNSNDYNSTSYSFKTHPCTGNKTLYYYSDSYNPDVMNPASYSGSKYIDTSRVVMQLISCSAPVCHVPIVTGVTHTWQEATITWTGEGNNYEVSVKEESATDWPDSNISVVGNSYTFAGLQPATNYVLRVRQDCSADAMRYSEWVLDDFLTDSLPCFAPDSLAVYNITNTDATFDWTPVSMESAWELHVWFGGGLDSIYYAGTHPFSVGDLAAGYTYHASVRPLCGLAQDVVGDWGDTITFNTEVCPDVTGLTTMVDANSVILSWTANPLSENWVIEYGLQGFDQGEGITVISYDTTYTVSDLMYGMAYDFHVRAVCGADWYSENWASATATTEAVGIGEADGVRCTIFPNPTSGRTTIIISGISGSVRVAVVDIEGREVVNEMLDCSSDCSKTIDVEGLAQGAYFVRITAEDVSVVRKLIVR